MGRSENPGQVVRSWIDAVNAVDVALAGTVVTDDVAIVGPGGMTSGRHAITARRLIWRHVVARRPLQGVD
jgi:ketosteroid isomerase-like protein